MHYTFKLGSFTCTTLSDFARERTPRETFPKIDPAELKKEIDLGSYDLELDRPMPLHGSVLLIDTGNEKILIDAGLPTEGGGQLVANLAKIGLSPDDIDMVLVTHGDGDHIGGLSNFRKAKIIIPNHAYLLWTEDTDGMVEEFVKLFRGTVPAEALDNMATGRAQYATVLDQINDRIELVEPGEEIVEGLKFIPAPGHRRDHTAVEVSSNNETLLHVADAWRLPVQIKRHDFYCLFDSYPETLAESMVMLLDRAAESHSLVFGAHFNFPAIIKIEKVGNKYQWIE